IHLCDFFCCHSPQAWLARGGGFRFNWIEGDDRMKSGFQIMIGGARAGVFFLLTAAACFAQVSRAPLVPGTATVLGYQGAVEVQRAETARWDPAYTNQVLDAGNRLRTDKNSLAMLRFSDLETVRVGPRSLIRIE